MPHFLALPHVVGQLTYTNAFYYPLKTHKDVRDLDLLVGILGQLAKFTPDHAAAIQIRVTPAGSGWQRTAASVVAHGIPDPSFAGRFKSHPHARLIETKTAQTGLMAAIRILAVGPTIEAAKIYFQVLVGLLAYILSEKEMVCRFRSQRFGKS